MKNKKFCCNILMLLLFLFFTLPCVHADSGVTETANISVTPSITVPTVIGDKEKFEEDHWISRNTSGGIDNLSLLKKLNEQDSLAFDGRAIFGNNDYNSNLSLSREGVGSLGLSFKEFRKYYDGTGGFYSGFAYTPAELDNDLNLDIGSFKLEGILAKEDAPEYSLSYERAFRDGSKSLLRWHRITGPTTSRYINPSYLETDEKIDRVKFGVKHETSNSSASAEQLWESTRIENKNINSQTFTLATSTYGAQSIQYTNMDSDVYTTTLRYAKELNSKLTASCGLLYNRYFGGSMENSSSTSKDNPASIEQNNVTLMPNLSFAPLKDLLLGLSSKAEFNNKNGTSNNSTLTRNVNIKSDVYSRIFTQNLDVKYKGMKNVVWFAEGEFEKRYVDQFEEQNSFTTASASENFSRKTDEITNNTNVTVGCKWYPVSKLNLTLQGKGKDEFTDFKHEFLTGDVAASAGNFGNYRGFYDSMSTYTRTPSAKVNYKPYRWLSTNLSYAYEKTIYGIRTRASDQFMKSRYFANIYSTEVTLIPYEFLYCSLFFERKNATTKTAAESVVGTNVVLPLYNADFNVYRFNYGYALTKNTTINGGYSVYNTENFNDFSSPGIPLGLDNTGQDAFIGFKHSLSKDRSFGLKYTYAMYDEDSNNNVDDYEAHLVSAFMNMAF